MRLVGPRPRACPRWGVPTGPRASEGAGQEPQHARSGASSAPRLGVPAGVRGARLTHFWHSRGAALAESRGCTRAPDGESGASTRRAQFPVLRCTRVPGPADILGVPFEEVTSPEDLQRHIEALAVRFKAHQQAVPERVRLAVAQAAVAARHYVELEALAERPSRYEQLTALFPDDLPIPARQIWRTGRDLAVQARQRFSIPVPVPVPSMLNLVTGTLKILVMWQRLPIEVAGYALCDEIHGPLIVVNVNGRNKNELVRRFTLAHETAHVLFDRQHMEERGSFDVYEDLFGYADDSKDPREVRANAFAIHLLSPEFALNNAWNPNEEPRKAVRSFMTSFGISYEAARHHLANYELLPIQEKLSAVATSAPDPMKVVVRLGLHSKLISKAQARDLCAPWVDKNRAGRPVNYSGTFDAELAHRDSVRLARAYWSP